MLGYICYAGFLLFYIYLSWRRPSFLVVLVAMVVSPARCPRPDNFMHWFFLHVYDIFDAFTVRSSPFHSGPSGSETRGLGPFARFPSLVQAFTLLCINMRTAVKYLWPLFHAKFYGAESSGRSDWHRDKWVNLAVSMVHSSLTSILATIAILSAWGEYADNENWIKVSWRMALPPLGGVLLEYSCCELANWRRLYRYDLPEQRCT